MKIVSADAKRFPLFTGKTLAKFARKTPFDRFGWRVSGLIISFGTSYHFTHAAYTGMAG